MANGIQYQSVVHTQKVKVYRVKIGFKLSIEIYLKIYNIQELEKLDNYSNYTKIFRYSLKFHGDYKNVI